MTQGEVTFLVGIGVVFVIFGLFLGWFSRRSR